MKESVFVDEPELVRESLLFDELEVEENDSVDSCVRRSLFKPYVGTSSIERRTLKKPDSLDTPPCDSRGTTFSSGADESFSKARGWVSLDILGANEDFFVEVTTDVDVRARSGDDVRPGAAAVLFWAMPLSDEVGISFTGLRFECLDPRDITSDVSSIECSVLRERFPLDEEL